MSTLTHFQNLKNVFDLMRHAEIKDTTYFTCANQAHGLLALPSGLVW